MYMCVGSGIERGGAIKVGGAGMLHGLLLTKERKYAEQDEQKKQHVYDRLYTLEHLTQNSAKELQTYRLGIKTDDNV